MAWDRYAAGDGHFPISSARENDSDPMRIPIDRIAYVPAVLLLAGVAMTAMAEEGGVQSAPVPAAAAPDQPRFDISEYRVEGNTLLPTMTIERLLYPRLGKDKIITDVEAARAALEQSYREAGFPTVLVNIPVQDVVGGVVRLQVVEGRIDRLRVTGSRYFSLERIRSQVPSLAEGVIPNLSSAQAELAALNRQTPDRTVIPVMRPGLRPGTVEVELKVKDELPVHGSLELDNRNTVDTSTLRLTGSLRYDNLWQREHSLSLQYQTAPQKPSEVEVWVASYIVRSTRSNNVLALYGVHSESNSLAVGTLGVLGKGSIFGAREIVPLEGTQRYSHSLTLGADYKDFRESIVLAGADTLNTPIAYVPWTIQYSGTRTSGDAHTQFGTGVTFGIRGLGNEPSEFERKRFDAKPNFIYLKTNAEREQGIYYGVRLRLSVSGQVTDSPLISNEQFAAGGVDSVRGYHESERLGDDAIQGTLEFSRPFEMPAPVQQLRPLIFADGARLRIRDALPGQEAYYGLSSAGVGVRAQAWKGLTAALDWARVFQGAGKIRPGDQRIHFSLAYNF